MAKQRGFYFNSSTCSGCKACQMACKDKNDLEAGVIWRRVYEITGGGWEKKGEAWIPGVYAYNLSISCNHCSNPLCMSSCPNSAVIRGEEGIVTIDPERCMGCRYCEWACPYGAPQFDGEKGIMTKCDLCADYLSQDRMPACVAACPQRALDSDDIEKLKKKYKSFDSVHPLPDSKLTRPSLLIKPHRDEKKARETSADIANREEV
ncbi:DMSO/selenate family reductase complex B subunit [Acidobacteriota bacterium]